MLADLPITNGSFVILQATARIYVYFVTIMQRTVNINMSFFISYVAVCKFLANLWCITGLGVVNVVLFKLMLGIVFEFDKINTAGT